MSTRSPGWSPSARSRHAASRLRRRDLGVAPVERRPVVAAQAQRAFGPPYRAALPSRRSSRVSMVSAILVGDVVGVRSGMSAKASRPMPR